MSPARKMPYPVRITVLSVSRYAMPRRGEKLFQSVWMTERGRPAAAAVVITSASPVLSSSSW